MDQEVMKEKRKRVQYLKKMQTQQYKEFYRLVGECREQKGKLREILWTGRAGPGSVCGKASKGLL